VYTAKQSETRKSQELAAHLLLTSFKDWVENAPGQSHEVAGLRISLRSGSYSKPDKLGPGVWVTYQALTWAREWLEKELGLIEMTKRGFNFGDGGKTSIFKPTLRFRNLHSEFQAQSGVTFLKPEQIIQQPIKPGDLITFNLAPVPGKRGMRQFLSHLNKVNCRHEWTIEGISAPLLFKHFERYGTVVEDGRLIVHPNALTYSRVFSSADLKDNGRFFSQLESLPRVGRQLIRLDGQKLSGLDYNAVHARIAYSLSGTFQPTTDPYLVFPDEVKATLSRPLCKAALLVVLNLESRSPRTICGAVRASKAKSDTSYASNSELAHKLGLEPPKTTINVLGKWTNGTIMDVVQALEKRHVPIAEFFYSGRSLELMRKESDIAEAVGKRLIAADKPVLMVHDAFYVRESDLEALRQAMFEAFQEVMGQELPESAVKPA